MLAADGDAAAADADITTTIATRATSAIDIAIDAATTKVALAVSVTTTSLDAAAITGAVIVPNPAVGHLSNRAQ